MLKKLCFTFLCTFVALPLSAETVTLSTLLDEMIDRDAITRFPEPAYMVGIDLLRLYVLKK